MTTLDNLEKAAELIRNADGLVIAAGAGMGVDSGLPDFRGSEGFWRHYPALKNSGIDFYEMASPPHFQTDPTLAWGFYGHRLALYRDTPPHEGFHILRTLSERLPLGSFVFTSNVDGQFQKAGFPAERIYECHGSLHHLQCLDPCSEDIWSAENFDPIVDTEHCRLLNEPPTCPQCNQIARPNVLMFNDMHWVPTRTDTQGQRLRTWLRQATNPVVIELGAGTAVATVRYFSESLDCPLIRINPREAHVPGASDHVSIEMGALDALMGIEQALEA